MIPLRVLAGVCLEGLTEELLMKGLFMEEWAGLKEPTTDGEAPSI